MSFPPNLNLTHVYFHFHQSIMYVSAEICAVLTNCGGNILTRMNDPVPAGGKIYLVVLDDYPKSPFDASLSRLVEPTVHRVVDCSMIELLCQHIHDNHDGKWGVCVTCGRPPYASQPLAGTQDERDMDEVSMLVDSPFSPPSMSATGNSAQDVDEGMEIDEQPLQPLDFNTLLTQTLTTPSTGSSGSWDDDSYEGLDFDISTDANGQPQSTSRPFTTPTQLSAEPSIPWLDAINRIPIPKPTSILPSVFAWPIFTNPFSTSFARSAPGPSAPPSVLSTAGPGSDADDDLPARILAVMGADTLARARERLVQETKLPICPGGPEYPRRYVLPREFDYMTQMQVNSGVMTAEVARIPPAARKTSALSRPPITAASLDAESAAPVASRSILHALSATSQTLGGTSTSTALDGSTGGAIVHPADITELHRWAIYACAGQYRFPTTVPPSLLRAPPVSPLVSLPVNTIKRKPVPAISEEPSSSKRKVTPDQREQGDRYALPSGSKSNYGILTPKALSPKKHKAGRSPSARPFSMPASGSGSYPYRKPLKLGPGVPAKPARPLVRSKLD